MYRPCLMFLLALVIFSSCDDSVDTESLISNENDNGQTLVISDTIAEALTSKETDHEEASDYVWDESQVVAIQLNGNSITAQPAAQLSVGPL